MLSNSSKYAIKAVLFLAINSNQDKKIMVKDIYSDINVSETYLAKLLQKLSRHNIISSSRGPKGGFFLTDRELHQSLIEIVRVIDGEKHIHSCVLGISQCDAKDPCVLHDLLGPSKTNFMKILATTTIYDVVHNLKKVDVFFPS